MIKEILHVGITVSNLEKAMDFYGNILELTPKGRLLMEGEATDKLFSIKGCRADIAYFSGSNHLMSPPIELIELSGADFTTKSSEDNHPFLSQKISEICFRVKDIDKMYEKLKAKGVNFLSEPIYFDFTPYGFQKCKVVYFTDLDNNVLELIEDLN